MKKWFIFLLINASKCAFACSSTAVPNWLDEKIDVSEVRRNAAIKKSKPPVFGHGGREKLFTRALRVLLESRSDLTFWDNDVKKKAFEQYQARLHKKIEAKSGSGKENDKIGLAEIRRLRACMDAVAVAARAKKLSVEPVGDAKLSRREWLGVIEKNLVNDGITVIPLAPLTPINPPKSPEPLFVSPCPFHQPSSPHVKTSPAAFEAGDNATETASGWVTKKTCVLCVAGVLLVDAFVRKERSLLSSGKRAAVAFWRWITGHKEAAMPTEAEVRDVVCALNAEEEANH
ncbi:MAG: hypothetical protein QG604_873 [Candidatus Dependentiae bacterium]|nr:hypothetical protein [Candidatus Dependentiae bacterium]